MPPPPLPPHKVTSPDQWLNISTLNWGGGGGEGPIIPTILAMIVGLVATVLASFLCIVFRVSDQPGWFHCKTSRRIDFPTLWRKASLLQIPGNRIWSICCEFKVFFPASHSNLPCVLWPSCQIKHLHLYLGYCQLLTVSQVIPILDVETFFKWNNHISMVKWRQVTHLFLKLTEIVGLKSRGLSPNLRLASSAITEAGLAQLWSCQIHMQLNLTISNSVNSKSLLFQGQAAFLPLFNHHLVLTRLFRITPLFRTSFHVPWDFKIAGFNCMWNCDSFHEDWQSVLFFLQSKADILVPRLREYHERLQTFLMWFVDGASYIDVDDDQWHYYFLWVAIL